MKPNMVAKAVLFCLACLFSAASGPGVSVAGEGLPGNPNYRVEMGIIGTEDELAELVKVKLESYPHVIVKVKKGIVILSGAVFNELKRQEVLDIVRSTGGVEGVDDEMRVRH